MTTPLPADAVPPRPPAGPFPRAEAAALALVLAAFVGVLAATTLRYQPVWLDEVTVADPAVNLYFGKGFTSTGWQYQTKEEFWASNAPLHQILLFHWMKAFGFNPVSVRSISFVLMAATIALLWFSVWKLGLVRSVQGRMLLVLLLMGGAGITFNFSMGRYDCVGILLLAGAMAIYALDLPLWIKAMPLMTVGILIPVAGVNLLPYGAVLGGLLLYFLRKDVTREAACVGAGVVVGLLCLYVLYVTNDVAKILMVSAGGHGLSNTLGDEAAAARTGGLGEKVKFVLTHFPAIVLKRLSHLPSWYLSDYSVDLVFPLLGLRAWQLRRAGRLERRSVAVFGLAAFLLVPFVLGLMRDYPFYYSWMAYVPLSICTVSAWDDVLRDRSQVLARVAVAATAVLAAWQGFPSRLAHAFRHPAPDHRTMEEFVRAAVVPSDKAYADFEPYYPMRRGTTYVLLPTYAKMMSPKEKSELTVLVVRAPNRAEATTLVGGSWKETAALDLPEPYDLRVLRRQ